MKAGRTACTELLLAVEVEHDGRAARRIDGRGGLLPFLVVGGWTDRSGGSLVASRVAGPHEALPITVLLALQVIG